MVIELIQIQRIIVRNGRKIIQYHACFFFRIHRYDCGVILKVWLLLLYFLFSNSFY